MFTVNHFGVWDYIVVAGTLIFSLMIGVYYAVFSKQTKEDFLMGSRELNVFAISASMIVTYLSAITILGYPSEIYVNGLQIFMMHLLSVVFVPISIYLFVSVFYKMKLTSVYEYLEKRFDTMLVRRFMSITYIVQTCVITGIVLYAPSIALERILGLPVWISIVSVGLCGTIYTSIGGYKAVIFTDVFQFFMIIIGMLGIVVKGMMNAGGVLEAFRLAGEHGRLTLIDTTVDPFMRHNTLNFILGSGFNLVCFYGTAQSNVQRYCSLPTFGRAVKAIFLAVVLKVLTQMLVVFCAVSIFASFVGCDPLLAGHITKADQIVPHFVVTQLGFLPGVMGLFVSCIFSAVLSSISSSTNSLSAVTWEDFLSHIPILKKLGSVGQTNVTRAISFFYGALCMALAFGAQKVGAMVFQASMSAVGSFSGAMGGTFILGLFIPIGNKWGAIAGMLAGLSSMMFITIKSFLIKKPYSVPLPTYINDCPPGTDLSMSKFFNGTSNLNSTLVTEIDWPDKLFTLSYILYPFVGAIITLTVGIIVSLLTGGYSDAKTINPKYLHPLLRKCACCPMDRTPTATYIKAERISGLYAEHHLSNPNLNFNSYKYDSVPPSDLQVSRQSDKEA